VKDKVDVVIAGGGPCGLMLANELGRRGISAMLFDSKSGTTANPQANATQARTMEHYRRLGFADEIRALGMPPDFPTDIAYFTRFATHELARFSLPSAREAKALVTSLSGSWSAAELPHRCNQKYIEPVLRRHAEALHGISIEYKKHVSGFREKQDGVEVDVEGQTIECKYLVGADGARSLVRQQLGFRYGGETGIARDFVGGRMLAVYARIPDFYRAVPHGAAWMNVSFNRERRAFMPAMDGKAEFAYHTQLRPHEAPQELSDEKAIAMVQATIGLPLAVEVLGRDLWTAGHSLVADRLQSRRVFIGGDAAHLFTPTGGLGYNTAVEDAVNLGWKLAAVLRGQAGAGLLESYEAERRVLAQRNVAYAKRFADSLGLYEPVPEIEDDTPSGEAARKQAGEYLAAHGRAEFNIPGVTFGGRYDGSPAIVPDGTQPPPDTANLYVPTACPGGRPPHLWMDDGRSLYDLFGFDWTLLLLGKNDEVPRLASAAGRLGVDLRMVRVKNQEARDLYQADLALIRPDQIVAWRGNSDERAEEALKKLLFR
jgi:2-polyprenyl-6-methoxyphenol hydroxylase-like FAD-dependent oxidoreductase